MLSGMLTPVDDGLATLRFQALQRAPSHQITVVEIDVPSLRAAGHWPWGRDRFATAIGNLQAAGAKVVAFDVDFSATSTSARDAALADAIAARPGSVILPTFVQPVRGTDGGSSLVETSPLRGLSTEALLASVNIPVDADGRVRRYTYGFGAEDTYRPSMGASLAQTPLQRRDSFLIDYGARVREIDHLSFDDVYSNRFDPKLVRGRSILIGATALELGDEFATPQAGTVNGVYIHALAFENLTSGRALMAPPAWMTFALACLLILLLRADRELSLGALTRRHIAAGVGLLTLPVFYRTWPRSAPRWRRSWPPSSFAFYGRRAPSSPGGPGRLSPSAKRAFASGPARTRNRTTKSQSSADRDRDADAAGDGGALAVVAIGIDRYPTMRAPSATAFPT
uniref:CHASE2 domain-containing protein n=1 Tax=Phenylobacterium glaciei TaxID=2803784 RepID=A0A974S9T5_9CAUL|nr:CHASE2 domain-containing protein [Phenylobacterium glaciei]